MASSAKKPTLLKYLFAISTSLFFLIVLFSLIAWQWFLHTRIPLKSEMTFEILRGETARDISEKLYQEHVIALPYAFEMSIRLSRKSAHLKVGEYRLYPNLTSSQLLEMFVKGDVIQHPFTIIEGWSVSQLKAALQQEPDLKIEVSDLPNDLFAHTFSPGLKSMEGLLYPDTYFFVKGASDTSILQQAFLCMQHKMDQLWRNRAEGLPFKTSYDALIMASLIEKETAVPLEMPLISGVFVERMRINMPLQTDPTVIYALGDLYQGHLTHQDLQVISPYNTYKVRGLPPTPIAFPSESALIAALHPTETKALYFVAKGDGTHTFSENYSDHVRAIKTTKPLEKSQ